MKKKTEFSPALFILGTICCVCLVVSNILAVKQFDISLFGFTFPSTAGLLIFPISYIINDCIAEIWGYKKARLIIWLAFGINFFAIILFQLSVLLPPSPHWADMQVSYASVLAQTPRIAFASLLAFLVGSFLNAYIMSKMKVYYNGRYFAWRAIASTVVGELFDTLIFTTVAFLFVIPFEIVLKIIIVETVLKTLYEIIILPVTKKVVSYIKKTEETDVFDKNISYNILHIKDV